ncbi:tape measure protein [Testudinibacter sp. P27/CKL/0425]
MANNSTSFFVNLGGNLQANAARNAKSMEQMANRSAKAMTKIERSAYLATKGVMGLSRGINTVGNWAVAGMVGGAALASRSLIKTAAEFEMAAIRMKQTFKDDGDKAFKWVTEFATKTPMEFMDVQDAAMRLKTAGIDPMNGSLQALVDYNAKVGGTKDNLNGYIAAISKANIKGKVSWEEVNPLLERNIPVFEMLAKADGGKHSADFYKDLLSKGKLGRSAIAALLRQMGVDAAGAAEEQMKTWDGMMSNIGDNITMMQAKLMQKGIFDELKNEVGSILAWINEKMDNGEFDEFAQSVSDTLLAAIKGIKELGQDVKPVLESLGSVISWIAEKSGGYGNVAKFMAALYLGNKVARWGLGKIDVRGLLTKLLSRSKGVGVIGNALDGVAGGVTPVYVTNLGALGAANGVGKAAGNIAKTTAATTAATVAKNTFSVVKNATVPLLTLGALAVAAEERPTQMAIAEAKEEERAPTEEQFYRHLANQSKPATDFWAGYQPLTMDPAQKARIEKVNAGQAVTFGAFDRQLDNEVAAKRLEFGTYTEEQYQNRVSKNERYVDDMLMKFHGKTAEIENKTTLDGEINVKISAPQGFGVVASASSTAVGVARSALDIAVQTGNTSRQLNGGN